MNNEKEVNALKCPKCDGQLDIDGMEESIKCPYCGTSLSVADLLKDSDAVKIEKLRVKAFKEAEMDRAKKAEAAEKKKEEKDAVEAFKKGKFSKVLIGFSILCTLLCLMNFSNGRILSGLFTIIITALFVAVWLMGMKMIEEPRKGARVLLTIGAFALFLGYCSFSDRSSSYSEKIDWDNIELNERLPKPAANKGHIYSDSSDRLYISIDDYSEKEYEKYLKNCRKVGFGFEVEETDDEYSAFNKDGYRLELKYTKYNERLTIELEAPIEMSEIRWPNSAIANLLPIPNSMYGSIVRDKSELIHIYIGKTSLEEYAKYVEECTEKGFFVDYEKDETSYKAYDDKGNRVSVLYKGNKVMYIEAELVDKDEVVKNEDKKTEKEGAKEVKTDETQKEEIVSTSEKDAAKQENDNMDSALKGTGLLSPPSEDYIIRCLEKIDEIDEIEAVTENNDPNGNLNEEGGYISQVFFSSKWLNQDEIYGDTLIDKGTDAGGSVEVYRTEVDAKKRDEYLAGFDDNIFLDSGSHLRVGTVIVRTSTELDESQQSELETRIIKTLTDGSVEFISADNEAIIGQKESAVKQVTVTMSEEELKGLDKEEAEKKLREMGFTVFNYITTETEESADMHDTVCSVSIYTWLLDDGDFSKGDTFDENVTVEMLIYEYKAPEPTFYSTNDYKTAKNGNTGKFAYKNKGGSYDIYYIIDFDEGYVFHFSNGSGDDFCDKVKIVSGTLNDKVTITWHDGGDTWSEKLHFKYVNHPETLVWVNSNGFEIEFGTTDIDKALKIRDKLKITEY